MLFIGELSALMTAVLWAGTSVCFTEASVRVGSLTVNLTRLVLATIYLLITIFIVGYSFNISFHQFYLLAISGIVGLVIGDSFLFMAFKHIGPRIAMLIMAFAPPMAAVLAYIFLGEELSILGILGIVVTVAGIAIVVLQKNNKNISRFEVNLIGVIYALLGAAGQAGGLIFAKLAFQEGEIDSIVATFYRIVPSIVVLFPIAFKLKEFQNPFVAYPKDKRAFVYTSIGSVIGPYLGITFSLIAISHTQIGIASALMAVVPIVLLPAAKYYYKEKLSWKSIIGAFVAVAGVAILFLK